MRITSCRLTRDRNQSCFVSLALYRFSAKLLIFPDFFHPLSHLSIWTETWILINSKHCTIPLLKNWVQETFPWVGVCSFLFLSIVIHWLSFVLFNPFTHIALSCARLKVKLRKNQWNKIGPGWRGPFTRRRDVDLWAPLALQRTVAYKGFPEVAFFLGTPWKVSQRSCC